MVRRVPLPFDAMALSLETLRELVKIANVRTKCSTRTFDQLKDHVTGGGFLTSDEWEALELAWRLRELCIFSHDEYTEQIDAHMLGIVGKAPPPMDPLPVEEKHDAPELEPVVRTKVGS